MRQQEKKIDVRETRNCYYKAVRTTHKCKASAGTSSPHSRRAAVLKQGKASFRGKPSTIALPHRSETT
jgi:hypothetical protein